VNQERIQNSLNRLMGVELMQKLRFGLVGGLNTLVSYLAFVAIYQWSSDYIASSVLAYLIGMLVSFTLNRVFVFKSTAQKGQFLAFCCVNLTALACSTLVLHMLVSLVGISVYVAQVLTIGVSMVINFLGYRAVFKYGVSMKQVLSAVLERSGLEGSESIDGAFIAKLLLLIGLVIISAMNLTDSMSSDIAHDAMPYMDNYIAKFTEEGRWINFILYDFLCTLPSPLVIALCNLFIFIFGFQVARGLKFDLFYALCFALIFINVPNFTMLFKWPMTLLSSTLALAMFGLLKDRFSRNTLLICAGVILFATYPGFYFLMPLLFIKQVSEESYPNVVKFVLMWILGYALGFAVAQGTVYLYTMLETDRAHFIELAKWRQATPLTDIASLITNVTRSAGNFQRNALYLAELSPLFFVPIIAAFLWALKEHLKFTLIVLLVTLSLYASVIVLGVEAPLRTGVTLPIGMMMIASLVKPNWARVALMVTLIIPFAHQVNKYNTGYNGKRVIVAKMLEANDPHGYLKQKDRFTKVVLTMDDKSSSRYFYDLTQGPQFENISYLRSHYIKPYLYKHGWRGGEIETRKVEIETSKGEAFVRVEGDTVFLDIR
jgi:putative flippase GtrA